MGVRAHKNRSESRTVLDPTVLADVVKRIVRVARPEKIILFGSAARGEMGRNSDVDLLVVKRGKFHRGRMTDAIYRNLRGSGAPVDVVLVSVDETERFRNEPSVVIAPALREGKVVYGE
jgi:predicted nucleotidyltransferase